MALWKDQFRSSFSRLCDDEQTVYYKGTAGVGAEFGEESPIYGGSIPLADSMLNALYPSLEEAVAECGSPIEEAMLLALLTVGAQRCDGVKCAGLQIGRVGQLDTLLIEPQFKVGQFRTDFLVTLECRFGYDPDDRESSSVIVECDGHHFHERTKEQAKRDRARDRKLQLLGHQVLHFTGSEIWADPLKCADEIYEHLLAA